MGTIHTMYPLLLLSVVASVSGHGSMLWPPIWQDGHYVPLEKIDSQLAFSDPLVEDPNIPGKPIKAAKVWLTDQAYLEGHGDEYYGVGNATNPNCKQNWCRKAKTPWASPGRAPSLGGGCGIYGGNPYGCPSGNDTRPPGSICGQEKPRATFSFGSSALDIDFPAARTTKWKLGSRQKVAWVTAGGHWGGYTYRLCKLPKEGKKAITEECFAKNVLEFATSSTMMRYLWDHGNWEEVRQDDLTEGTYPEGSAWRSVAKKGEWPYGPGLLRKDWVKIPADLPEGDYVLGFRWDTLAPQVWVSCANVRLVTG